jgi:uncharacterized protein YfcZ (UPF0381/DUF406 family)
MANIDKIDIDNKNVFKKVTEKAVGGIKKVAGKAAESFDKSKLKIKTIDKIKATWNSGLLNKYDNKSVKMMAKRNIAEEKLKLLINKNEEGERRIANLQKEYKDSHGGILLKIEAEFSREKQKNAEKIEKTKNKIDKIKTKEGYYKAKGEVYENKTKNIIGGVLNKVEKRLNPHEVKVENLKNKIGVLASEVKNFESARVKLGEKVDNLKKKLEAADFKAEKKGIKRIIGEIENEIRRTEKIRLGRLEEQSKMENKLAKITKKVNKWNVIHNQFSRIITEKPTRAEHKNMDIKIERPDLKNVEVGDKKKKRSKKEGGGGSESSFERESVFSLEEYVENWNKYFGSQFKIDSKLFLEEALEKKMEIPFLEDHIRMIYKKKREADKSSVGSFSERDLEKSLKSLNNYL